MDNVCEEPRESYTVMGVLNVEPTVAAAFRLVSVLKLVVATAGRVLDWLTEIGARVELVETTPFTAG